MSTRITRVATAACAAAALIALPTPAGAADNDSLLPGDVRVWELNHPAGVTPTLLPGDVRVWELNHPTGVTPTLLPGDLRHRGWGGPADLSARAT